MPPDAYPTSANRGSQNDCDQDFDLTYSPWWISATALGVDGTAHQKPHKRRCRIFRFGGRAAGRSTPLPFNHPKTSSTSTSWVAITVTCLQANAIITKSMTIPILGQNLKS